MYLTSEVLWVIPMTREAWEPLGLQGWLRPTAGMLWAAESPADWEKQDQARVLIQCGLTSWVSVSHCSRPGGLVGNRRGEAG